eukprot:3273908-Lingulodinium_polyedra.AAC.1
MPELDMPPGDVARGQPFVKERPADEGSLDLTLTAGDVLIADLPAGSRVTLRGAVEQAEVVSTRGAWLRISVPGDAGIRAA